jgi:hypothetical protein
MSNSASETANESRHESQPRRLSWQQRPRLVGLCVILLVFGPVLLFAAWEAGWKAKPDDGNGAGSSGVPDQASTEDPSSQEGFTGTNDPANETPKASIPARPLLPPALEQELRVVQRELEETQEVWTRLDQNVSKWEGGPSLLLSPEMSRKVVSDSSAVEQLAMLLDRDRPSVQDVQALEKQLAQCRQAIEQLQQGIEGSVSDVRQELKKVSDGIKAAHQQLIDHQIDLDELVAYAKRGPVPDLSLEDSIEAARQTIVADALATLVNELREETRANEETLLEEVKRAVRKEQQPHLATVRKKREQVQQEKQRVEEELAAQARARQQETEMLMLKKRFEVEYPEMKIYLVGLTTDGYRQFVGSSLGTVTKAGPLSYRGMIHAGVLNDGVPSLEHMHYTIGSTNLNDRDLGAFPIFLSGGPDFENKFPRLLTIQKFVREFGPVMVELGLLAP